MVQLSHSDIRTREVLGWKGLHLFHMSLSSCSQKVRIALNIKKVPWTEHPVDLLSNENLSEYFLGINPRGLVPVLIDDGAVHIESNDILLHINQRFPDPPLVSEGREPEMKEKLRFEDDLHLDLRTLSFRFLFGVPNSPKSASDLEHYASTGSGTVDGQADPFKAREIDFWQGFADHGITDAAVRKAAANFQAAFKQIDTQLSSHPFLMGDAFSLLDIAWIVYANRLKLAGYPLERLHRHVAAWLNTQLQRPEVAPEIALPGPMVNIAAEWQEILHKSNAALEEVCFS